MYWTPLIHSSIALYNVYEFGEKLHTIPEHKEIGWTSLPQFLLWTSVQISYIYYYYCFCFWAIHLKRLSLLTLYQYMPREEHLQSVLSAAIWLITELALRNTFWLSIVQCDVWWGQPWGVWFYTPVILIWSYKIQLTLRNSDIDIHSINGCGSFVRCGILTYVQLWPDQRSERIDQRRK